MKKIIFLVLGVYLIYYAYHIIRDLIRNKEDSTDKNRTVVKFQDLEHQPEKVDALSFGVNSNDEVTDEDIENYLQEPEFLEEDFNQSFEEDYDEDELQVVFENQELVNELKEEMIAQQREIEKLETNEEIIEEKKNETAKQLSSFFSDLEKTTQKDSSFISISELRRKELQQIIDNPDSIDTSELGLLSA